MLRNCSRQAGSNFGAFWSICCFSYWNIYGAMPIPGAFLKAISGKIFAFPMTIVRVWIRQDNPWGSSTEWLQGGAGHCGHPPPTPHKKNKNTSIINKQIVQRHDQDIYNIFVFFIKKRRVLKMSKTTVLHHSQASEPF